MNTAHRPSGIQLHTRSRELELHYPSGEEYRLSCEYLRVYSPSAEVRGHHPDEATLQHGKCHVGIDAIEPVGNYALQLVFDDGHNSGIYSWEYLRELCEKQQQYWSRYLEQLAAEGKSRDPEVQVVKLFDPDAS